MSLHRSPAHDADFRSFPVRVLLASVMVLVIGMVWLDLLGGLARADPPPTSSPATTAATTPASTSPSPTTDAASSETSTVGSSATDSPVTTGRSDGPGSTVRSTSNGNNGTSTPGQSVADTATSDSVAPLTTTQNLLIGPPVSEATTTTVKPQDLSKSTVTRTGGSSDPKIWAVVIGLVVVALGLAFATWRYWKRTKPDESGSSTGGNNRGRSRYADLVITSPESP